MTNQMAGRNLRIFQLLKYSMIIHIICIIANIILHHYVTQNHLIMMILHKISFISLLLICAIIGWQAMETFIEHHRNFIDHHKLTGLIVETSIAGAIFGIIFLNKEITSTFVSFIIDLSAKTHEHSIMLIALLLLIFYGIELDHAWSLHNQTTNEISIKKTVRLNIKTLVLKFAIIGGSIIGFLHPILHLLTQEQIEQFDKIVLGCTTKEFFTYMRSIILLLLGLWTIVGIYYAYKFYKKRK